MTGAPACQVMTGAPAEGAVWALPAAFPDLMRTAEVAALFRVRSTTVLRWADAGHLSSTRTLGGHRRFSTAEVRALLAGRIH
jgi:excisionase family DNA binding protein